MIEVKICGVTCLDDARAALDAGADWIGFVTYLRSPRGVGGAALRAICERLPSGTRTVGVFVNEPRVQVEAIARDCNLAAIQLHGDERAEDFRAMDWPVWRAIRLADGLCRPPPDAWGADRYVVDAAPAGVYGGAGAQADWAEAAGFARKHPMLLAGGLTPGNVAEAVARVRPLGVDVSSGVEARPGRKDPEKVRAFIAAARTAARGSGEQ